MKHAVGIFTLIVLALTAGCSSEPVKSDKLSAKTNVTTNEELNTRFQLNGIRFYGLGYGPFSGIENPACCPYPTIKEMESDIAQIAKSSKRIRIYSTISPFDQIGGICQKYGVTCLPGCWIGKESFVNENEMAALIRYARIAKPKMLVVGNEVLLRGDLTEAELIKIINHVRRATGLPVGTAELWITWLKHPTLAKAVDFMLVHAYAYWDGVVIDEAADYVTDRFLEVKSAYPEKEVILGETGWPSSGPIQGNAIPSLENQQRFAKEFVGLAEKSDIPYYFFEAFNEDWKTTQESGVGGKWGVLAPKKKANFDPPVISKFPFVVYDEPNPISHFVPSGWMGDLTKIEIDANCSNRPHSGKACTKLVFRGSGIENGWRGLGWVGIYWQYPEDNWGDLPGYRFYGVKKLTFWAKGATGKERCEFKVGGIDSDKTYIDSLSLQTTGVIDLTRRWRQYTINISKQDLNCVISGFCWVTNYICNPKGCTIFLDDVQFE